MTSAINSFKKNMSLEKVCSLICIIAGTVFLVIALFGAWRYYFTMGLCYGVAIMVYEDNNKKDKKKH